MNERVPRPRIEAGATAERRTREAREAEALRANLLRRKAQARARADDREAAGPAAARAGDDT